MFIIIIILVFAILSAFIISYLQNSLNQENINEENNQNAVRLLNFIKKCENELNEHTALILALREPLGIRILEKNGFYFEILNKHREEIESVLDKARTLLSEKIIIENLDSNVSYSNRISTFITENSPLKEEYSNLIISCSLILRTEKEEFKYFPKKLHLFLDKLNEFKNEFITYYENTTNKQFNEGDILSVITNDYTSNKLFASLYRQLISNIEQIKKYLVENISESNYNSAQSWYEEAYIEYFEFTEKFAELKNDIESFKDIFILTNNFFKAGLIDIKNSIIKDYSKESILFLSLHEYCKKENSTLFEKRWNESQLNIEFNKTYLSNSCNELDLVFLSLVDNYFLIQNLVFDIQKFNKNFIFLSNTELNTIKYSLTSDKIEIIQKLSNNINLLFELENELKK
jgi:hypothetical protein